MSKRDELLKFINDANKYSGHYSPECVVILDNAAQFLAAFARSILNPPDEVAKAMERLRRLHVLDGGGHHAIYRDVPTDAIGDRELVSDHFLTLTGDAT